MNYDYNDENLGCGAIIVILLLAILFTFLCAWFGVMLWGAIAVAIFGLPALSYWQFFGLMILIRILIPGGKVINKKSK